MQRVSLWHSAMMCLPWFYTLAVKSEIEAGLIFIGMVSFYLNFDLHSVFIYIHLRYTKYELQPFEIYSPAAKHQKMFLKMWFWLLSADCSEFVSTALHVKYVSTRPPLSLPTIPRSMTLSWRQPMPKARCLRLSTRLSNSCKCSLSTKPWRDFFKFGTIFTFKDELIRNLR